MGTFPDDHVGGGELFPDHRPSAGDTDWDPPRSEAVTGDPASMMSAQTLDPDPAHIKVDLTEPESLLENEAVGRAVTAKRSAKSDSSHKEAGTIAKRSKLVNPPQVLARVSVRVSTQKAGRQVVLVLEFISSPAAGVVEALASNHHERAAPGLHSAR